MSFSFCFSPMRRAALFAPGSSFLAALVFVAGNAVSFLVFVIVAASNAFSFWLCGIRYRQCSSPFCRLWHSVPERAFYGTEYACRAQNRLLGYATHFQRHSVQKTGVSGTEGIFGAQNSLPWYAAHHGYSVQPPSLVRNRSLGAKKGHHRNNTKKTGQILRLVLFSSGGWTRTNDLRVMSPTSYQLLYPAMFGNTKVGICFEFAKFFSLLLQILRSAARFLPVPRLFSAAEELSH